MERKRAVKMLMQQTRGARLYTMVACVMFLAGMGTSAQTVLPGLVQQTALRVATPYRVVLETPQTIFQGQDVPVVVRVQNRQGLPLDGIAVAFQIGPRRARYTSIRPAQARTEDGKVQVLLRAELVGPVHISVQVGVLTKRATITVVMPIATGQELKVAHAKRTLLYF